MTFLIQIPQIGTFEFEQHKGWTQIRFSSFMRGFKRSILTERESPKEDWIQDEKRGFDFGEKIVAFALRHGIKIENILRAGVICGPLNIGESNNRKQRAKAIFQTRVA